MNWKNELKLLSVMMLRLLVVFVCILLLAFIHTSHLQLNTGIKTAANWIIGGGGVFLFFWLRKFEKKYENGQN
jgi:hypothetical protein